MTNNKTLENGRQEARADNPPEGGSSEAPTESTTAREQPAERSDLPDSTEAKHTYVVMGHQPAGTVGIRCLRRLITFSISPDLADAVGIVPGCRMTPYRGEANLDLALAFGETGRYKTFRPQSGGTARVAMTVDEDHPLKRFMNGNDRIVAKAKVVSDVIVGSEADGERLFVVMPDLLAPERSGAVSENGQTHPEPETNPASETPEPALADDDER